MEILGLILSLAGFVCAIIILIDAFKNAVWKGIVGLICGFYLIYYAFAEFQHEQKWPIVIGMLVGSFGGAALRVMGAAAHLSH